MVPLMFLFFSVTAAEMSLNVLSSSSCDTQKPLRKKRRKKGKTATVGYGTTYCTVQYYRSQKVMTSKQAKGLAKKDQEEGYVYQDHG